MTDGIYDWIKRFFNSEHSRDRVDRRAIDEGMSPEWTGDHRFQGATFEKIIEAHEGIDIEDGDVTIDDGNVIFNGGGARINFENEEWFGVLTFIESNDIQGRLLIDSFSDPATLSLYDTTLEKTIMSYQFGSGEIEFDEEAALTKGEDHLTVGDEEYVIQKDGTDGPGIINFKTE